MDSRIEENVNDVISQIKSAQRKGKRSVQIKIVQWDYIHNHPAHVMMKYGLVEGGEGANYLKKLGYNISYITTEKQATSKAIGKELVVNVKPLHTTNMIVRW